MGTPGRRWLRWRRWRRDRGDSGNEAARAWDADLACCGLQRDGRQPGSIAHAASPPAMDDHARLACPVPALPAAHLMTPAIRLGPLVFPIELGVCCCRPRSACWPARCWRLRRVRATHPPPKPPAPAIPVECAALGPARRTAGLSLAVPRRLSAGTAVHAGPARRRLERPDRAGGRLGLCLGDDLAPARAMAPHAGGAGRGQPGLAGRTRADRAAGAAIASRARRTGPGATCKARRPRWRLFVASPQW